MFALPPRLDTLSEESSGEAAAAAEAVAAVAMAGAAAAGAMAVAVAVAVAEAGAAKVSKLGMSWSITPCTQSTPTTSIARPSH